MPSRGKGPLRIAVVGAGNMGANHLRVYSQLRSVDLVGVVESDPAKRNAASELYECRPFADLDDLIGKVDAVSIASPSSSHAEIGALLLERGIACLIEKPLATTRAECQRLIEAADSSGACLMVGHIEQFNPAVRQLAALLGEAPEIYALDARRMSATSSRIADVDVVLDLMVHDLDIVLSLVGRKVRHVSASGISVEGGGSLDYVTAVLTFDGGTIASLTSSRITQNKVRELTISARTGHIMLHYGTQELTIHRQRLGPDALVQSPLGNYLLDLSTERVLIRPAEPLSLEIQHFVECVRTGAKPKVDGRQALAALELVWTIRELATAGLRP
jgi:predicted dehydrogenase